MAMILKDNETYTDIFGYTHSDFYAVIDDCHGRKDIGKQYFKLLIYKSKNDRENKKQCIEQYNYVVDGSEWDEFFAVSSLNDNIYAKAYEYIIQEKLLDSENNPTNEFKWVKWRSDNA